MPMTQPPSGPIFTAAFATTALSTTGGHDLLTILSSAASRVEILEIKLGQSSSSPAGVQGLGVRLWRGSTGVSTGAAITPVNLFGWSAAKAAVSGVTGNSSATVSTTSAALLHAEALSAANGSLHYQPLIPPILEASQRAHINVTTPSVATTIFGTVTFREPGKSAG